MQRRRIDSTADHFARAVLLKIRMFGLEQRCALSTSVLDTVEASLFLLDDTGRLLLDNAAARNLVVTQPGALRFVHGRFTPSDELAVERLARRMRARRAGSSAQQIVWQRPIQEKSLLQVV